MSVSIPHFKPLSIEVSATKSGVEWINSVPPAPRAPKGRRCLAQESGPFAAAPRLGGPVVPGPFAPAPRLTRSPGVSHTPDRRAHGGIRAHSCSVTNAPSITPLPRRLLGKNRIADWLIEVGLEGVDGLLDALLLVADDLKTLSQLSEEEATQATSYLGLRGIKLKKLLACLNILRAEALAFTSQAGPSEGALERPLGHLSSSVTRNEVMPPPPFPRVVHGIRFKQCTSAENNSAPPPTPEKQSELRSPEMLKPWPSEACELNDLASLLETGNQLSTRPNLAVAARALAEAAAARSVSERAACGRSNGNRLGTPTTTQARGCRGCRMAHSPQSRLEAESLAVDLHAALDAEASTSSSTQEVARGDIDLSKATTFRRSMRARKDHGKDKSWGAPGKAKAKKLDKENVDPQSYFPASAAQRASSRAACLSAR